MASKGFNRACNRPIYTLSLQGHPSAYTSLSTQIIDNEENLDTQLYDVDRSSLRYYD
jgi:hypothetical protein